MKTKRKLYQKEQFFILYTQNVPPKIKINIKVIHKSIFPKNTP